MAVILAGGLSRRMGGGDKALRDLGGRPLIARVIDRLAPQCGALAINANGPAGRFGWTGLPVLPDGVPGFPGPLAGILAAMEWAAALGEAAVLTVPADTPFLPPDLAARLAGAGPPAVAESDGRRHPVVGLWPVGEGPALRAALDTGMRAVRDWPVARGAAAVAFAPGPPDPFLNLNTPDEAAAAERWL